MAAWIRDVIHASLSEEVVTACLKVVVMGRPLLNKSSLELKCLDDYHPVVNVPFLGKVLELVSY